MTNSRRSRINRIYLRRLILLVIIIYSISLFKSSDSNGIGNSFKGPSKNKEIINKIIKSNPKNNKKAYKNYPCIKNNVKLHNPLDVLSIEGAIPGFTVNNDILDALTDYQFLADNETTNAFKKEEKRQQVGKVNGAIVVYLESGIQFEKIEEFLNNVETFFNAKYKYPWVFLSNTNFDPLTRLKTIISLSSHVIFATIPRELWKMPSYIDLDLALEHVEQSGKHDSSFGYSFAKRHQNRFLAANIFHHPIIKRFDYIMLLDTHSRFTCNITDVDYFEIMKKKDLLYGFTVAKKEEVGGAFKSLWTTTLKFLEENPEYNIDDNALDFIADIREHNLSNADDINSLQNSNYQSGGVDYLTTMDQTILRQFYFNGCAFSSVIGIFSTCLLNGKLFDDYFDFVDRKGLFFLNSLKYQAYRSFQISLFIPRNKIWHFADIGIKNGQIERYPELIGELEKCQLDGRDPFSVHSFNFDSNAKSCLANWERIAGHNSGSGVQFDDLSKESRKDAPQDKMANLAEENLLDDNDKKEDLENNKENTHSIISDSI